ncbi:MAG: phospholipase D-like domain-containing protein [Smithella sp.]
MSQENKKLKETVFADAGQYFAALLQDIDEAKTQIDLETYIFDLDPLGKNFAEHLAEASRRGVSVRLLLDGAGSLTTSGILNQQLSSADVQVRIYHPLPWHIDQLEWVPHLPWLTKLQRLLEGMQSRNHRKICMIDRRVIWVGSFNVSQSHLPKEQGGQNWRDTAVRIEVLEIEYLRQAFNSAWNNDRSLISRKMVPPANIRLNHIRRRKLRRDLLKRMAESHSRIWIANAYFVPITSIVRSLKKAARRGVDVRILLPKNSDVFFIPWASAMYYQVLLKAGVKIYEYSNGMLHEKIMILDDWITVGTSNMDYLSFFRNLEADVVIMLSENKKILEDQFLNDLNQAVQLTSDIYQQRPWWKKIMGRLFFYIRRWL